jgi:hypothetical protein
LLVFEGWKRMFPASRGAVGEEGTNDNSTSGPNSCWYLINACEGEVVVEVVVYSRPPSGAKTGDEERDEDAPHATEIHDLEEGRAACHTLLRAVISRIEEKIRLGA